MPPNAPNGWMEWGKHVLSALERNDVDHEKIFAAVTDIKVEIATLKVKAGIWGVVGGAIPVLVGIGLLVLKGMAK